jgi:anti-sigma factor RsiW
MTEQLACRQMREGLTEYLDDALPSERRQGLESHLASCPDCRGFFHQMGGIVDRASALPREPMPSAMKRRLLQAFRDRSGA